MQNKSISDHHRQPARAIDLFDAHEPLEAVWIGPGPEAAPTLVFLHEGLGCVGLWRDIPARLAEMTGCGALVYSRKGYGASAACTLPRPIDFMHLEGQAVLPDIIKQCRIGRHVLVGHSDGGSIALINAGGRPPELGGVVTLAAHVCCEAVTRDAIRAAHRRYLDGDLKKRLSVHHGENTDCAFRGWSDTWLHPDFERWNIETFLPSINVPVLAIQGTEDPYGSSAQVASIQAGCGSRVTVRMVDDCGHAPHLEKRGLVLPVIRDFVQQAFSAKTS